MKVEVEIPDGETCTFKNDNDCKFNCYIDEDCLEAYCRLVDKQIDLPGIKHKNCPANFT